MSDKCPECGQTLESNANFCHHCGTEITHSPIDNQVDSSSVENEDCPWCGTDFESWGSVCLTCGKPLPESVSLRSIDDSESYGQTEESGGKALWGIARRKKIQEEQSAPTTTKIDQPETVEPTISKLSDEHDSPLNHIPGIDTENTTRRNVLVGSGYVFGGLVILGAIAPEPEEVPPDEEFAAAIEEGTNANVIESRVENNSRPSIAFLSYETGAANNLDFLDETDFVIMKYAEFIESGWDVLRIEVTVNGYDEERLEVADGASVSYYVMTSLADQYNRGDISKEMYLYLAWETLEPTV